MAVTEIRKVFNVNDELISLEAFFSFLKATNRPQDGSAVYNGKEPADPVHQRMDGEILQLWLGEKKFEVYGRDKKEIKGEDREHWSFNSSNQVNYLFFQVRLSDLWKIEYRSHSGESMLTFTFEDKKIMIGGICTTMTLDNLGIPIPD